LDDVGSIPNNRSIREVWRLDQVLRPPQRQTVEGRPILNLSFALNYAVGSTDVRVYHATNVLIHLAGALALLGLLRCTLRSPACGRLDETTVEGLALAVTVIWAVHPLQTSAVTYIVQRAESLMALFYLLLLYCIGRGAGATRSWPWFLGAVAACVLGMGVKEVMASAPVVALVYDRVFLTGSWRKTLRERWGLYALLAASWILLAFEVSGRQGTAGFSLPVHPLAYGMTQLGVIGHYLRLVFWPIPLVFDYEWPIATSVGQVLPGAVVVTALLGLTVWGLIRRPAWGFLGLCFFAILAPTSSIVPIRDVAFEHRMYLPLAAVVTASLIGGYLLWRSLAARSTGGLATAARVGPWILAVAAIMALGWLTFQRNADYRSAIHLLQDTLQKRPNNPRAHCNLGARLAQQGDLDRGLEHIERAIALDPAYGTAYGNRATIRWQQGQRRQALEDADRAIQFEPDLPGHYYNRAQMHLAFMDPALALKDLSRVIALDPDDVRAYRDRGQAYVRLGEDQQAAADFAEAIDRAPAWPDPHLDLAQCYYRLGHYDQARAELKRYEQFGGVAPADVVRQLQQAGTEERR
jgi:Flp pilus assembly protein TadD